MTLRVQDEFVNTGQTQVVVVCQAGLGSALAPVRAHLAAEVASQSVDGAADVSQLLLGLEAVDVPAVPQHPAGQRGQHQQAACREERRRKEEKREIGIISKAEYRLQSN